MDALIDSPESRLRLDGATFQEVKPEPSRFGRLKILSVADALNAPPRDYLLEGMLAPGECSVWWGPPKSGKSFLMLRLAYGLSQGRGMWGREAVKVAVCYVAAEGESGVKARLRALHDVLGPASNFHLIAQAVDLFDLDADLNDLLRAVNALSCGLVVLDTLARVMGAGDENATRDMNAFVRNCDRIREETARRAHVAIVHHGGWDGGHARGSIALIGAADVVVKISGEKGGRKTALVEYAKDDESGYRLGFDLKDVELPPDAKGRPRSTCLAVEAEATTAPEGKPSRPRLSEDAESLLRHITDEIAAGRGRHARPEPGMPLVPTLSRDVLNTALTRRNWLQTPRQLPGGEKSAGRVPASEWKRLYKRLTSLQNKGLVGFNRHDVWLVRRAEAP